MLRGIRKASENWLGRGLMAAVMTLLAGSFAVWGINDIFRGFGRATLAKIGSTEIPIDRFRQNYQDRLQQIGRELGRPLPADRANALGLDRQVLGEMIAQAGLDQRVRQMGLGWSDAEIARRITSDPKLHTTDGHFDRAKFELILRNMGYSEQGFVAEQRQDALRRQILGSVSADLAAPKAWLEAVNQFQNQKRSVEYIWLGPAQAGDIPRPTDEELKKYFDERKILFRAPEYRKVATVTATSAELAKWMEVSDDDIKQAYDQRRASFTTAERRHVEQIVFPTLADAQAAADRIKKGARFGEIASERGLNSEARRSQRANTDAVRSRARHGVADRPRNDAIPCRSHAAASLGHCARTRQVPGAKPPRKDRGRSSRRQHNRRSRSQAEAAGDHLRSRPVRA